jgi:phosphatidylethanolamine/phosphatidyl-N-methylethanolamine N-methyltransferase
MSATGFEYGKFLRGLLNNPKAVSAPTPSSPALARAIAEEVDPQCEGLVVELGPGTGVVTRALLNRGVAKGRLITIEFEPCYVKSMRRDFPGIVVHQGDAMEFEKFLPAGAGIAAVVSGIPLLNFPIEQRRSLLRRALAQPKNRRFIQLSYSWAPPVLAGTSVRISRKTVWRNFPPAHVWTYVCDDGPLTVGRHKAADINRGL